MSNQNHINIFWFRRDLRLYDNAGLYHALISGQPVQCLFIFDSDILDNIEIKKDRRLVFIHSQLEKINLELKKNGATLIVRHGNPLKVWGELLIEFQIDNVYTNNDYEPYSIKRDEEINRLLKKNNKGFFSYKDQVIFEKDEILKDDGTPYVVFTPFMKKWRSIINIKDIENYQSEKHMNSFYKMKTHSIPSLKSIGFENMAIDFPIPNLSKSLIKNYEQTRDIPSIEGTTRVGVHLRFGTVSIRQLVKYAWNLSDKWVNELIWREFYMMILWHFPHVIDKSFRSKYDMLQWHNNEDEFEKWCEGKTGYPIVDAGMRELNETGFMHNRLRMITSMFLTKYLLIDWRWGEAYFAQKLLDYELSSNNGGWQWSAGTGVDAAPYFRIFNMTEQTKRFDPTFDYIKKWLPEFNEQNYPAPIIDYSFARKRCLDFYRRNLKQ